MSGWEFYKVKVFAISIILLLAAFASAKAHAENRFQVIEDLKAWQLTTTNRLDLDDREKDLRLDFIDRLIFQVERKYQENSLQDFLIRTLEDMDETDQLKSNQSFTKSSSFIPNLQFSLKNIKEKNEKTLEFIKIFTEFSGISEPASPDEFADNRSYYDGKNIHKAKPMNVDQAASVIEKLEAENLKTPDYRLLSSQLQDEYLTLSQAISFHDLAVPMSFAADSKESEMPSTIQSAIETSTASSPLEIPLDLMF